MNEGTIDRHAIAKKAGADIAQTLQAEFESGDLKVETEADFDKRYGELYNANADIPDSCRFLYFYLDVRKIVLSELQAMAQEA